MGTFLQHSSARAHKLNMDDLHARFEVQMRRAFFDKLTQDLEAEDPQAVDWLINLHVELVRRIAALRPGRKDEIMDKMDSGIFGRKIKAKAFRGQDMAELVGFSFEVLREIVAPDMDQQLRLSEAGVYEKMEEPEPKFSVIVPSFLSTVHHLLDETVSRINEMRKEGMVG